MRAARRALAFCLPLELALVWLGMLTGLLYSSDMSNASFLLLAPKVSSAIGTPPFDDSASGEKVL